MQKTIQYHIKFKVTKSKCYFLIGCNFDPIDLALFIQNISTFLNQLKISAMCARVGLFSMDVSRESSL